MLDLGICYLKQIIDSGCDAFSVVVLKTEERHDLVVVAKLLLVGKSLRSGGEPEIKCFQN